MAKNVALIVGSNGIVGWSLATLLASNKWEVIGLSRRPSPLGVQGRRVEVDLQNRDACLKVGPSLKDVTHLFYCARAISPDLIEEEHINFAMFANILDAVEANSPALSHVQVMQGTKWYGCHLGPCKKLRRARTIRGTSRPTFTTSSKIWSENDKRKPNGPGPRYVHISCGASRSAIRILSLCCSRRTPRCAGV